MERQHNRADNRRRAFLRHLGTFAWVMALLAVIDVMAGSDQWFIHWVAAIWGTVLAVHFVDAFVLGGFLGFRAMECGPRRPDTTPERDEPRSA
jgi:hypothetical protein